MVNSKICYNLRKIYLKKVGILDDTLATFARLSEKSEKCLVAYSGGKDSMVVLDMAVRNFKTVSAFNMQFFPGLKSQEVALKEAQDKYGIDISIYPHWLVSRVIRDGHYCDQWRDFPDWSIDDVYQWAMSDAGVDFLITGARSADSPTRRRYIGAHKGKKDHIVYPIVSWNKYDVLGYLKMRGLKIPESSGGTATGIDTSSKSLNWLHDHHRKDFEELQKYLPYIEAAIWRKRYYGI